MKKRIMILGASRYYIRTIMAAKELGCEVIVSDRNPTSPGFTHADHYELVDITDIDRTMNVARKYAIDGIVAVNDFGVPTAAAVADALKLPGIRPEVAQWATSKALMRMKWEDAGVPSARYRVVLSLDDGYNALDELDSWPLVVKPADSRGGGSRGVSVIEGKEDLAQAVRFAQSFYSDKAVVIEEFLWGIEHSVETITYGGETHVIAVSDKVKTPLPYRVDQSVIYPTILGGKNVESIDAVAKSAVKALEIDVGAAHVEMCSTSQGPKLFELGARCGGGGTPDPIIPFLTGIDMVKEVVRIALGEQPVRITPMFVKGCVYRFLMPRPGKIRGITGIEAVKGMRGILDCDVLLGEGDEIRAVRTGGDRAGFLIAGGKDREEALRLADRAEASIGFEYE